MPTGQRPRPPTRTIRVAHEGTTLAGTPWVNVHWLFATGSGPITVANLRLLAEYVGIGWGGNVIALMNELTAQTSCEVTLYGSDLDVVVAQANITASGTSDGFPVPAQVCLGVGWNLALSYRGGHPRSYIAGVDGNMLTEGNLVTSAFADSLAAGANDYHAAVESFPATGGIASIEHGVVSFQSGNEWRTPPIFRRIVNSHVDRRVDTQRRRLGRDIA